MTVVQGVKMELEQFDKQIQGLRRRVSTLYRSAQGEFSQQELLSVAFEELQCAMEELQAAEEELRRKNETLEAARDKAEMECRRYQELFEHAPDGYLVTGLDGTIRQANQAAARLLNSVEKFLVGRSLALFIPEGERRAFRSHVARLRQSDQVQEWEIRMQPWKGTPFDASLRVAVARGPAGQPSGLRWMLRDVTRYERMGQDLRSLTTT